MQDVWDIEVETDHSYLANGFVNHNSSNNPNLQNIPRNKKIRGAFIPEPGKVFVIADYGQLELRVLAHFSQDKVLVDAFQTGKDPHSATAAKAKGIDYDTFIREMKAEKKILETYLEEQEKYRSGLITKVDLIYPDFDEEDLIYIPLRQGAKTVNFGIVYGGGAKKLGVSEDFIMVWKAIHGGASNYIRACHRYCERTCSIPTLSGRFRTDPGAKSSDQFMRSSALRGLFSAHIQGSAADIVKKAMINLHAFLQDIEGANILLQVHDELIVECYEADAHKIVGPMQHILENAYTLKIPLEATPSIGHSWADKK